MRTITIYDTTLRDGSQSEEVSFTVEDKIRIAHKLDELGVHYIEGGWPGSNPRDIEFFNKVRPVNFRQAKMVAFGSTRRVKKKAEDDPNLADILRSETATVTIFGKSWGLHVLEALNTSLEENLHMVGETIAFLKKHGREVMFDAEHFFDGYKDNPDYAMKVIETAVSAGADWVIPCDTNGGSLPSEIYAIFKTVRQSVDVKLGIHTHNDSELGVANAIAALQAGAQQVQGTINGMGERCGNANLISLIANIKVKLKLDCIADEQMQRLKEVSAFVDELANRAHWSHQPFVGKSAFAHKGGIHVSGVRKNRATYEHIVPESVGNHTRILISDLAGKSSIQHKAKEYGVDLNSQDDKIQKILADLKQAENLGFQYEGAEGSFELLMRDALGKKELFFDFIGFRVIVEKRCEDETPISEATVKIKVNGIQVVTAAEGSGPVNALDQAIRKALVKFYPELEEMRLLDYKVRILEGKKGTEAKTRVLIESGDHHAKWETVGVSENIIEASWQALMDGIQYKLSGLADKRKP